MTDTSLDGKVAIVSGAGRGLGRAMTLALVGAGARVAALEASSANWAGDVEGTGVTVNVLIPGGPADTPFVPVSSQPDRSRLVRPERMASPIRWLLSDASDGVNGRRFVANDWNPDLPWDRAAEAASAPIAWKGFGRQAATQPVPGSN